MKWIFILFLMGFKGCDQKKAPLNRTQFIDITAELYLAEALASKQDTSMIHKKDFFKTYQREIFQKHHIDSSQYYASYEVYNERIDTMQVLMNDVISKLSVMQAVGLK